MVFDGPVTSIGYAAFGYGYNEVDVYITRISIPSTVTSIGEFAFMTVRQDEQSYLTLIEGITDNITSIGRYAFYGYLGDSIHIPANSSYTTIENYTFYYCSNIDGIYIPNNILYIGDCAFASCYNVSRITLPSGLLSMGTWAFGACASVNEIEIPSTVTSFGDGGCFNNCADLSTLNIHGTSVKPFPEYGLIEETSITASSGRILVNPSLVNSYKTATGWSYYAAVIDSNDD